jgi:hypothetical protein
MFEHFLLGAVIATKVFIPDFPRPLKKFQENQKGELERILKKKKYKQLKSEFKNVNEKLSSAKETY